MYQIIRDLFRFSANRQTCEDTFQYYQAYGAMPDVPDNLVLTEVRNVLTAATRDGDPLNGAVFTINHQCYIAIGEPRANLVKQVTWYPVASANLPANQRIKYGKYFYSTFQGDCPE